jgi:hypothetical protein
LRANIITERSGCCQTVSSVGARGNVVQLARLALGRRFVGIPQAEPAVAEPGNAAVVVVFERLGSRLQRDVGWAKVARHPRVAHRRAFGQFKKRIECHAATSAHHVTTAMQTLSDGKPNMVGRVRQPKRRGLSFWCVRFQWKPQRGGPLWPTLPLDGKHNTVGRVCQHGHGVLSYWQYRVVLQTAPPWSTLAHPTPLLLRAF